MTNETVQAAREGISWASLIGGIVGGAMTVAVTHALFKLPKVRVRSRRNLQWNNRTGEILSNQGSVRVANVRGRPVQIDAVYLMHRGDLAEPSAWTSRLPTTLQEGDVVELEFKDTDVSSRRIRPVAKDSLDRYWPRHRHYILWLMRWYKVYPVMSRRIRHGGVPTDTDLERVSAKIRATYERRRSHRTD